MTLGATRFVRYAYPPNALGYCGPDDHVALGQYGEAGVVDGGLVALITDFEGAWPYLELIGHSTGHRPLDDAVVRSYWLGGGLLDRIPMSAIGNSLADRFRLRAGSSWQTIEAAINSGARPSHAFHVFAVYPWVGLMRSGTTAKPLEILDRCRVRWGRVIESDEEEVLVESRPLVFEDERLLLGPPMAERVRRARGVGEVAPGDTVSLHWGWMCERLGSRASNILMAETRAMLAIANRSIARPRVGPLG